MKKCILLVIVLIVTICSTFAGGYYVGLNRFVGAIATPNLSEAYVDLITLQRKIEQFDRGDYEKLRESLNVQIDTEILRIDSNIQSAEDQERIRKSKELLKRVAEHRMNYPATYPKEADTEAHKTIIEFVNAILNRAMDDVRESNKPPS